MSSQTPDTLDVMLDLIDPLTVTTWLFASDAPRPVPAPSEVKAGYTALFLWFAMAIAVALLGWSLVRQLRRTQEAKENGVYGEDRRITAGPAFTTDEDQARAAEQSASETAQQSAPEGDEPSGEARP